jgi:IclR family KDG regulon transcriptional repressor
VSAGSQTADRVLRLLLAVARSDDELRITDLSRLTGFDRAAVHRLIQPLLEHGFVTRDPRAKQYSLGPALIGIWALGMGKLSLRGHARPVLERVAAKTSETVSLYIRDDLHRICIDSVDGPQPVRRIVPIGERWPLYAGTTGKTMLAFMRPSTIEAALEAASADGRDVPAIERDLAEAREKGYLVRVGDRISGVGGLSFPVFDGAGVLAVVTTSGPSERFSEKEMEDAAPFVARECEELSIVLGHVKEADDLAKAAQVLA